MKKPFIIGISGASGSGKTRFIKQVAGNFRDDQVCLISQDNYYKPRNEQPLDDEGVQNFDLPESMDLERFHEDIKTLISGEKVVLEEYTYNNPGLPKKQIVFKPAPVLIIEGIFIFYDKNIRQLIDLKLFLDAMEHIMLSRRIIRDEKERGYDLQDVLYRYKNHVMPAFRKFILPYQEECHLVIKNNYDFDPAVQVISAFISNILAKQSV